MPLTFGVGLLGHYSRKYSVGRVADLAVRCEQLGADSFWVADQRWMRDVWVTLTACAGPTSRIKLGTRVTDPYARHPALTAVAAASLDEVSGGRAILGIGAGGSGFPQMGIERRQPLRAIREMIELIRALLAGGTVEYEGRVISFKSGALEFETRPDIPIVLVSRGPKLLELGGEIADGTIIAGMAGPEAVGWGLGHVKAGMAKAGRPDGSVDIGAMVYTSISDDADRARYIVRRGITAALIGSFPNYDFLKVSGLEVPPDLWSLMEQRVMDYPTIMAAIPDSFVDQLGLAGTPAQCAAQIEKLVALGLTHINLAPLPVDEENVESVIEPFANEVMPRLRAASVV
jgi:5,10-methylenetetrahydromethanopterin reductase